MKDALPEETLMPVVYLHYAELSVGYRTFRKFSTSQEKSTGQSHGMSRPRPSVRPQPVARRWSPESFRLQVVARRRSTASAHPQMLACNSSPSCSGRQARYPSGHTSVRQRSGLRFKGPSRCFTQSKALYWAVLHRIWVLYPRVRGTSANKLN